MRPLLLMTIALLVTSCATILKRKTYQLKISSKEKYARVKVYDSIYSLPSKVTNTWDFKYYDRFKAPPPSREPVTKNNFAFGLVFPTYFSLSDHFNIGRVYRPTFFRPNATQKFAYEHLLSIDFAWKIRLKK